MIRIRVLIIVTVFVAVNVACNGAKDGKVAPLRESQDIKLYATIIYTPPGTFSIFGPYPFKDDLSTPHTLVPEDKVYWEITYKGPSDLTATVKFDNFCAAEDFKPATLTCEGETTVFKDVNPPLNTAIPLPQGGTVLIRGTVKSAVKGPFSFRITVEVKNSSGTIFTGYVLPRIIISS